MKFALIGATGNVGSRILDEAVKRGHEVTAVARHVDGIEETPQVRAHSGDINDPDALAAALADHDAIISAAPMRMVDPEKLKRAAHKAGVKRLLVVGGAGTLEVKKGVPLLEVLKDKVPPLVKEEMFAGRHYLETLRAEKQLDWTYFCPSGMFEEKGRTGQYNMQAGDSLLTKADGEPTGISMEDFAIAILDELAAPKHPKKRVAVGY